MNKELRNILSIFFIAFIIRLFFALNGSNILLGDEIFYENTGANILAGNGYSHNGHLIAEKPPGYPVFVSLVYSIFGHSFISVRVAQAFLDALMCIVLYAIARRLFNEKTAILSGVLCAGHYFFLKSLQLIRPDTLQMFFIAGSVFYWIKWREKYSKIDAALLGIFSSISIMLKANMAILPFLIVLIELFRIIKNKKTGLDIFIKSALIFALLFSFPVAVWTARNYKVFNSFIPLATDSGLALYSSYNPPEGKKFGILTDDSVTKKAHEMGEVERSRFLTDKTKEYIISHPENVIRLIPLKILFFWSVFDWETINPGKGAYNFSTAFILPFCLAGFVLLINRLKYLYPVTTPVIYAFALGIIFAGIPRFRLAIEPFLIIVAAFSMMHFYNKALNKRLIVSLYILWFGINFYMFINPYPVFLIGKSAVQFLKLW